MRRLQNIMVTGGAGFLGSNLIRFLFTRTGFRGAVVNVDKLSCAGNRENLLDIEGAFGGKRYFFARADACDFETMRGILCEYDIDTIVHCAAESQLDRAIRGPRDFVQNNVMGTFTLLEAARACWKNRVDTHFHHVSTDEVFGSLGPAGRFDETSPYDPGSPYSASKAASDLVARAMHRSYGTPLTISHRSNTYGPFQSPEKLIPLAIVNMLEGAQVPIHGDGRNVRDWLFVDDHSEALWLILSYGENGRSYVIGGDDERDNLGLVQLICERVAVITGSSREALKRLITFVEDRPGHDRRYAIDSSRIKSELGWRRRTSFGEGLDATIRWYAEHGDWVAQRRGAGRVVSRGAPHLQGSVRP